MVASIKASSSGTIIDEAALIPVNVITTEGTATRYNISFLSVMQLARISHR